VFGSSGSTSLRTIKGSKTSHVGDDNAAIFANPLQSQQEFIAKTLSYKVHSLLYLFVNRVIG
jgi:hypothetical protein